VGLFQLLRANCFPWLGASFHVRISSDSLDISEASTLMSL
jgi:hypothetical protein